MKHALQFKHVVTTAVWVLVLSTSSSSAFEGHIRAVVGGRGGAGDGFLYTVGTNYLRVEMTGTNHLNAIDVVNLGSGQITLIQPMNQTFVRFTPGAQKAFVPPPHAHHPDGGAQSQPQPRPPGAPAGMDHPTNFPGMPAMPMPPGGLPPGIGPQARAGNTPSAPNNPAMPAMPAMPMPPGGLPPGVGPQTHADAAPAMPAMHMMPPGGGLELKATGETTNLLNYPCARYEIKQNDQTMVIWATDQLLPFQMYLPAEPHRFAPPMIEEQWAGLVTAKKVFPLSAILTRENGVEVYRFEVQSIAPGKLTKEEARGFQPPEGCVELQARPF